MKLNRIGREKYSELRDLIARHVEREYPRDLQEFEAEPKGVFVDNQRRIRGAEPIAQHINAEGLIRLENGKKITSNHVTAVFRNLKLVFKYTKRKTFLSREEAEKLRDSLGMEAVDPDEDDFLDEEDSEVPVVPAEEPKEEPEKSQVAEDRKEPLLPVLARLLNRIEGCEAENQVLKNAIKLITDKLASLEGQPYPRLVKVK